MSISTKKLVSTAFICALAYILMYVSKIIPQVAGFLQYDLKDVAVVIGGFVLGPVYSLVICVVVTLLEFFTASSTGVIGLLMNFISTAAFCFTASLIYRYKKTMTGAIIGLAIGTIVLTLIMLLWNYFITPRYMNVPREVVKAMLVPVFLPFNLIKGLLNSGITLVVYRPIVEGLRRAGLVERTSTNTKKKKLSTAIIIGIVLVVVCVPFLCLMM